MAIKVFIPTPLRTYTDNRDTLEVAGSNIGEVLSNLTQQYSELKRHLFDEKGALRNFVNVYVNDEDVRYLQKDATPVNKGDVVTIVPSIAGG